MNNYRYRNCYCSNNSNTNLNCENNDDTIQESENCQNTCNNTEANCQCGFNMNTESVFPDNPMFAQSYVPIQRMNKVFTPEVGLQMGTIFPELTSPYYPCQSIREIEFIQNSNEIKEGCNK
jgi:hypothetical protein